MVQLITIGEITGPQGLTGEVRIFPLTDYPERFTQLKWVYLTDPLTDGRIRVRVLRARYHKNFVLLKLAGIASRAEAEKLRKWRVEIEPDQVLPLPPGHFYHFQIVGLTVRTLTGEELGRVVEILTPGGNDVYVIRDRAGKELLLPAIRQVVRKIDLQEGVILVELLEGLR